MSNRKSHWEAVYANKAPTEVSWYQPYPRISLDLIAHTRVSSCAQIIDVGGGTSTLADALLSEGFKHVTVLDIAFAAIEKSKARLAERANSITWLEADITRVNLPEHYFDLWHDRAVFHFLTEVSDRRSYLRAVEGSLKPGGHLIIATFAVDGPKKCSGLDTQRYSPDELSDFFGDSFQLVETVSEIHQTPFETEQKFIYCRFQRN
jgi:2-polyprenyl-3-methyl-5-hydroxy-6-metoxy-1,4-benzoquinol methylase